MKNLSLALLSLAIVSCGQSPSQEAMSRLPIGEPVLSNNPQFLTKEITTCGSTEFDDFKFDLSFYLEGSAERKKTNLEGIIQQNYVRDIRGKSVIRTTWGNKETVQINFINGMQKSAYHQVPPVEGKDVTICADQRSYDRNSIESATLNVTHYIDKVFNKIKSLQPHLALAPIHLKIGSEHRFTEVNMNRDSIQQRVRYWTDNAFYEPGKNTITFLPHNQDPQLSELDYLLPAKPYYWEIPMVAAHEYGHHIFHSLAPVRVANGLQGCFHHRSMLMAGTAIEASDVNSDIKNEHVEDALNEGFSDMIATYSLSKEEASLKYVKGLMINRDLNFSYFQFDNFQFGNLVAYEEKKFSDKILSEFFSPRQGENLTTFQQKHNIGAIFAYRADQFFNSLKLSKDQKLTALLDWVAEYGKARSSMENLKARSYMEKMLQLLVRTTYQGQNRVIAPEDCKSIVELYPIFSKTIKECVTIDL